MQAATEPRIRDAAIADVIIDARDDLVRSLPAEAYRALDEALAIANGTTFALPAPGRQIMENLTEFECRVTVRGKDYPHLIPENVFWRFYFQSRAAAARQFHREPDGYTPEHISVVRRQVPVPAEYIIQILNVATRVEASINLLPNTQLKDSFADAITEDAHYELIRALPEAVWLAVKADAYRVRAGMVMSFPSSR